jgi:diphthine-ammonia ligase
MELNESFGNKVLELKTNNIITNKEDIVQNLNTLLTNSVKKLPNKVAIAFSGGVDSSLITFLCHKLNKEVSLYAIGFKDSKDILSAQKVAKEMNWEINTIIISLEDCEKIFKEVIKITKKRDPITIGVGSVTYSVLKETKEDFLVTGLGSEEIFAGYDRHKGNINEECWKGLTEIWQRDLVRDISLAKIFNKEIKLPFLDKELIKYSMQIDESLKVQEFRKQILRETAVSLGLPKDIAFRKKCAAQYGSKFDYALEKLAKKKGLKKREYLEQLEI